MTVGNDSGSYEAVDPALTGSVPEQTSESGPKEQAKQAAGTAADETKRVGGVAAGEAQHVASEAGSAARDLVGEATSQVEEQSRSQRDRLVEMLRTLTDDLDKMVDNAGGGMASDLVRQVSDRARSLTHHLDGREPRELLEDLRGFARNRPGAFLGGALVAGVLAGRLTRGAKDAHSSDSSGGTSSRPVATYDAPTRFSGTDLGSEPVTDGFDETSTHSFGESPAGSPLTGPVETDPLAGGRL